MNTHKNTKPQKKLSKLKKVSLYVFYGCWVGALFTFCATVLSYLYTIIFFDDNFRLLSSSIYWLFIYAIFYYPVALFLGGIPAILTGIVINELKIANDQKLEAFLTGTIVSFIFYISYVALYSNNYRNFDSALPTLLFLSFTGGIAAFSTMRLIDKKESKCV